jgi:hypothetical protein
MQRATTIYGLIDPRTQELRYVGKTINPLPFRLSQHINDAARGRVDIFRFRWINKLSRMGLKPDIFEIETVTSNWQEAEQFWIAYFKSIGADLVNATAGGDGIHSHKHSAATKAKMSAAAKSGSYDLRKRRGEAISRALNRPESKARLIDAARKRFTPEVRAKISDANKRRFSDPMVREFYSAIHKGRTFSPEHKARISAAIRGRQRDPGATARSATWHRGSKRSAETKDRMRIAALAREQRKRDAKVNVAD